MVTEETMYRLAIPTFKVGLTLALTGVILGHLWHIGTALMYAIILAFLIHERNKMEKAKTTLKK